MTTSNPLTTFKQWNNKTTRQSIPSPSLRQLSSTYISMPPTRPSSSNSNWEKDRISSRRKNRESVHSSHRSFFHLRLVSGARVSGANSSNTRIARRQEPIRPQMILNMRGERRSARSNLQLASSRGPRLHREVLGTREEVGRILILHALGLEGKPPTKRVGSRIKGYPTINLWVAIRKLIWHQVTLNHYL